MTSIPGASRYLNQATLSSLQGSTATVPNILSESAIPDILDAGRVLAIDGVGISGSARQLNQQLLNNASSVNEMFSLSGGSSASIESAQIQINGLRASLPASAIDASVLGQAVDESVEGTSAAAQSNVNQTV